MPFEALAAAADKELGPLPEGYRPWKALLMDRGQGRGAGGALRRPARRRATRAPQLALAYLKASKAIGEQLVADGVALNADDVNGVLTNGFFHLYGPINDYAG